MTQAQPWIIVISAPTSGGKTTLTDSILTDLPQLRRAVTATTRTPRPGEVPGRDYHFVSREEFLRLRDSDGLVEWAEVHGFFYGPPKTEVERILKSGKSCVLVIDVQGARTVRKNFPRTWTVFIVPPNMQELEKRLRKRGGIAEAEIQRRLQTAKEEMKAKDEFDAVLLNDDFEIARNELKAMIEGVLRRG